MRPSCIGNDATNLHASVGAKCRATPRDFRERTINPCKARCNERLYLAARTIFVEAFRNDRLEANLRINTQREAASAWTANESVRT